LAFCFDVRVLGDSMGYRYDLAGMEVTPKADEYNLSKVFSTKKNKGYKVNSYSMQTTHY